MDENPKVEVVLNPEGDSFRAAASIRHPIPSADQILETAPIGFARSTPDGRLLYANPALASILGYDSANDLLSLEIAQDVYADYRQRTEVIERLNDPAIPLRRELEFRRKDGSIAWVEAQARGICDAEGRILHYDSFITDVTERVLSENALKQSEERWRGVFANSRIGIALAGPDGRFVAVNGRYQELVGYTEQELLGMSFLDITHPDDREENQRLVGSLKAEKERDFQFEKRYRRGDGQWIRVRTTVCLVPGPDGTVRCTAALVEDVTEKKRAEEQLDHSLQELRALSSRLLTIRDEEAGRIARAVHDEVGQSLVALAMDVAWLKRKLTRRGPKAELAAKLEAMSRLVDSTMESVQLIASDLRPGVLDELGLEAAVEWAVRRFEERTGLTCVFETSLDGSEIDLARATAAFRILQEALSNVARHARATRVEVVLSARTGRLQLDIRDNGSGIEAARIGDSDSLGLLGMRERARSLGGSLAIDRAPEGGTRITAQIPL